MDDFGNIIVDKVIKLEEINNKLIPLLKTLGIPDIKNIDIPHINKRDDSKEWEKASYVSYYTSETIRYVEEKYQYDIHEFGYSFGD